MPEPGRSRVVVVLSFASSFENPVLLLRVVHALAAAVFVMKKAAVAAVVPAVGLVVVPAADQGAGLREVGVQEKDCDLLLFVVMAVGRHLVQCALSG